MVRLAGLDLGPSKGPRPPAMGLRRRSRLRPDAIVLSFAAFAACAATQARPKLPGTYGTGEALPPPVAPEPDGALAPAPVPLTPPAAAGAPVAVDPGAEADFRDPKARFDAGAQAEARAGLEAFVAHHGQHPFRPAVD